MAKRVIDLSASDLSSLGAEAAWDAARESVDLGLTVSGVDSVDGEFGSSSRSAPPGRLDVENGSAGNKHRRRA